MIKELKKDNINISIICPGMVKTRIFYKPIIGDEAPDEYVKIPKEAISAYSGETCHLYRFIPAT